MGELTSLVTLCELGDVTRLSASRKAVRMAGIDIGVHRSDRRTASESSPAKAPRSFAGRSMRPPCPRAARAAPTTPPTSRSRPAGSATPAPRRRSHASSPAAPTTSCESLAPRRWSPSRPAEQTAITTLRHAQLSSMITLPCGSRSFRDSHPQPVAAHQRPSGRSHSTRTDRSTITSPTPTRSRTQISPGIHGATQHPNDHNHSPPPPLTPAPVQISDSAG